MLANPNCMFFCLLKQNLSYIGGKKNTSKMEASFRRLIILRSFKFIKIVLTSRSVGCSRGRGEGEEAIPEARGRLVQIH